jgi:hypothetical protein
MKLIGTKIHVESGGVIVADFLDIIVSELVVDDSFVNSCAILMSV